MLISRTLNLKHNEFEEIEGKMQRRGRLILGSVVARTSIRKPLIEVITNPSSDMENDPYEDVHKQPKVHEVFQSVLLLHSRLHYNKCT